MSSKKRWVRSLIIGLLLVGLAIVVVPMCGFGSLAGLMCWGWTTHPKQGDVIGKTWSHEVVLWTWKPVVSQWWKEELRARPGVPPVQGKGGKGSVRNIRDCVPKEDLVECSGDNCYKTVERMWCRYDSEEWITEKTYRASGRDDDPLYWPEHPPVADDIRTEKKTTYAVLVEYTLDGEVEQHTHKPQNKEDYLAWRMGEMVSLDRNNFGFVIAVHHLEAQ